MSAARVDRWVYGDAEWAVSKRRIHGEYKVVHRVDGDAVGSVGFRTRKEALAAAVDAWMAASHDPLFVVDDEGFLTVNEEVTV